MSKLNCNTVYISAFYNKTNILSIFLGMSRVVVVLILFIVQAVLFLIDTSVYLFFEEGFMARCILFKLERDLKRDNALPGAF